MSLIIIRKDLNQVVQLQLTQIHKYWMFLFIFSRCSCYNLPCV